MKIYGIKVILDLFKIQNNFEPNIIFKLYMNKDIALDDLIQADREKKKSQHKNKGDRKKLIRKGQKPNNRPDNRRDDGDRPRRGKFLKRFQNIRRREYVVREERPVPVPQQPREEIKNKLRVMGLHPDITSEDLYQIFMQKGALELCKIDQDNFGRSLTTAVVKYHTAQSAQNAIDTLHKSKIKNSIITVEHFKNKQNHQPRQYVQRQRQYVPRQYVQREYQPRDYPPREFVPRERQYHRGRGFNRRFNNNRSRNNNNN